MKKLLSVLVILLLAVSSAQAITVTSDNNTDLGDIAAGESITINLKASDYNASRPSHIVWTIRMSEGTNPGLKLDKRRGDEVKLFSEGLRRTGSDGRFTISVMAQDERNTGEMLISGRVIYKPELRTEKLSDVQAGGERKYLQLLDFNAGIDPLTFTTEGDFPDGLSFSQAEIRGKLTYVITGDTDQLGEHKFTLIATNPVGSISKEYTINVLPVAPRIKTPQDFPKAYVVQTGKPFYIDLKPLQFIGTQPLNIAIDDKAHDLGLAYDSDNNIVTGVIPEGTRERRASIRLIVSNGLGSPATLGLNLNITSTAYGIRISPATQKLQHMTQGSTDIYAMPVTLGKPFTTHFRADVGTKPITWDYIITGMDDKLNGKRIVKDLKGNYGGLKFEADGTISGTAEYSGHVMFTAEATNPAGVIVSEPYDFVFGRTPLFDESKTSSPVKLQVGKEISINPMDFLAPVYAGRFETSINVSGNFPEGLSFDGKVITGTPTAKSMNDLKKYTLHVAAVNGFGTTRGRISLTLQDVPKIGEVPEVITGKKGTDFRYVIPFEAKRPYTWRMEFEGKDVDDEIGDSGIEWRPRTASVYGSSAKMLDGVYKVTVYLMNDVGQDSRTFTIRIDE